MLSTIERPRKWQLRPVKQRVCNKPLRNVDLMFMGCAWNAPQFAHSKMMTAAWLDSSASRMTSDSRSLSSNRNSKRGDTSVFSFLSFTVSSILLRWYGLFYFILILSTDINYSTRDGLNTDTEMCTKQDLIKQRKLCVYALTRALRILSGSSSTTLGISWMPTNKV